jgi:predicted short-subunit dehydrogenase-like oxidoreductase (DUF2520 family)
MDKPSIALIGAGRLGTSLITALSKKGYQIAGVADADPQAAQSAGQAVNCGLVTGDPAAAAREAGFVIIAVPDSQIKLVAEGLAAKQAFKKGQVFCHTSGYLPSAVLVSLKLFGAYTISMHPFVSISSKDQSQRLAGAYYALEGDAVGLEAAREMVQALDGFSFSLRAQDKPLYHAASAMASNLALAMMLSAGKMLEKAGVDRESSEQMITAMLERLAGNVSQEGLEASVTGPIARGDRDTVAGHLQALRIADSALAQVYGILGTRLLDVLSPGKEPKNRTELEKTLREPW